MSELFRTHSFGLIKAMKRLSVIELFKENMKFSAGHFTIFSSTQREKMHGHNYTVHAAITTAIEDAGLSFDYRFYKDKIYHLCRELNGFFLIPAHSEHLKVTRLEHTYHLLFNNEEFLFPIGDVRILPLVNITVEELSKWFIDRLLENKKELQQNHIEAITIKVFSSPGQCGSANCDLNHE
jgi:6-pyruvoyltetrahydropterin/6-carboxytetrahydropterin synthase